MTTHEHAPTAIVAPAKLHDDVREKTHEHVVDAATLGPAAISERLEALDFEWPTDRVVGLGAAAVAAVGVALAAAHSPRWLALTGVAIATIAQQALLGASPASLALRYAGFRSAREIDVERSALKALRGDFRKIAPPAAHPSGRATQAILASEA